jgi:hypothetical protein
MRQCSNDRLHTSWRSLLRCAVRRQYASWRASSVRASTSLLVTRSKGPSAEDAMVHLASAETTPHSVFRLRVESLLSSLISALQTS